MNTNEEETRGAKIESGVLEYFNFNFQKVIERCYVKLLTVAEKKRYMKLKGVKSKGVKSKGVKVPSPGRRDAILREKLRIRAEERSESDRRICEKLKDKSWARKNETNRVWREKNRESINRKARLAYVKDSDEMIDRAKRYYRNNKEILLAQQKDKRIKKKKCGDARG